MKRLIVFLIVGLIIANQVLAAPFSPKSLQSVIKERVLEKAKERVQQHLPLKVEEFRKQREEMRSELKEKQKQTREMIKTKREQMVQKIQEYREQLRERLKKIKNETKKKIVERIYQRVDDLNERITNHFLDVLDRLEEILERIESRTAKAVLHGRDVSEAEEAIKVAWTAIETAREAVRLQAEKVYQPPEITSEENLRIEVGALRQQLHSDLKAVEKLVKEARDKVREAAVTLAKVPRINELEVPEEETPETPDQSETSTTTEEVTQ